MIARTIFLLSIAVGATCGTPAADADGLGDMLGLVHGSGNIKTEQRPVDSFDAVDLKGSSRLDLRIGPQAGVTVAADDNILDLVRTRVQGRTRTLVVDEKGRWTSRHGPVVHVVVPRLEALKIDGTGDASLHGISGDELSLHIEGSGNIDAEGAVAELVLRIEGSGDARLAHLQADFAEVLIQGSGNAEVSAAKSLKGVIEGSGDLAYYGNPPQLSTKVDGSGDIVHRK